LEYQDVKHFVNVFREQQEKIDLILLKEKARSAELTNTLERLMNEAKKKPTRQKTLF
jgi:hypothetical protein